MSSRKEQLLKKEEQTPGVTYFDFNDDEKKELGALLNLIEQARIAQDILYSTIVNGVAQRLEINNKDIEVNLAEVMEKGVAVARLVVK